MLHRNLKNAVWDIVEGEQRAGKPYPPPSKALTRPSFAIMRDAGSESCKAGRLGFRHPPAPLGRHPERATKSSAISFGWGRIVFSAARMSDPDATFNAPPRVPLYILGGGGLAGQPVHCRRQTPHPDTSQEICRVTFDVDRKGRFAVCYTGGGGFPRPAFLSPQNRPLCRPFQVPVPAPRPIARYDSQGGAGQSGLRNTARADRPCCCGGSYVSWHGP